MNSSSFQIYNLEFPELSSIISMTALHTHVSVFIHIYETLFYFDLHVFSSAQFSQSVMSDSLQPHGL